MMLPSLERRGRKALVTLTMHTMFVYKDVLGNTWVQELVLARFSHLIFAAGNFVAFRVDSCIVYNGDQLETSF
jgi:hypothetical protein